MKSVASRMLTVLASILAFTGAAQATEVWGPSFGGGGGTSYQQKCTMGSMHGMRIRAGSMVDAVGARCYQDNPVNKLMLGGGGGTLTTVTCPTDFFSYAPFAKGILGRSGAQVDRLGLRCTDDFKIISNALSQYGGSGGTAFSWSCGNGFSAKGFFGATGALVDRIGVICSNRFEWETTP